MPMKHCPKCGRTVMWHRVYRTTKGIRAYCNLPNVGRRSKRRYVKPPQAENLQADAADVWGRLHKVRSGTQLSMLTIEDEPLSTRNTSEGL